MQPTEWCASVIASELVAPPSPRNSFRPFSFPSPSDSPPPSFSMRRCSTSPPRLPPSPSVPSRSSDSDSRIRRCSRGWDLESLGRSSPMISTSGSSFLDLGLDDIRPGSAATAVAAAAATPIPGSPQSFLDFDAIRPGFWGRKSKAVSKSFSASSLPSSNQAEVRSTNTAKAKDRSDRQRQASGGLGLWLHDEVGSRTSNEEIGRVVIDGAAIDDSDEPLKTPTPESFALFGAFDAGPEVDDVAPPAPVSMPVSSPPIARRSTIDLPTTRDSTSEPAQSPHSPILSRQRLATQPPVMGLARSYVPRRIRTSSSGSDADSMLDSPFGFEGQGEEDDGDDTLVCWSPYSSDGFSPCDAVGSFTPEATCSPSTSSESDYSPRTPLHLELVDPAFVGRMTYSQDFGLGLLNGKKGARDSVVPTTSVPRSHRAQSLRERPTSLGRPREPADVQDRMVVVEAAHRTPLTSGHPVRTMRRNTLATSAPPAPLRRPGTPPSIGLTHSVSPPSAPLVRSTSLRGDTPSSRERRRRPAKTGPIAGRVLFADHSVAGGSAPQMERETSTSFVSSISPGGSYSLPALSSAGLALGLSSEKLDRSASAPGLTTRRDDAETLSPRRQYGRREGIRETGQWTRVNLQMVQLARRREFDDEELAQLRLVENAKASRRMGRMLVAKGLGIM